MPVSVLLSNDTFHLIPSYSMMSFAPAVKSLPVVSFQAAGPSVLPSAPIPLRIKYLCPTAAVASPASGPTFRGLITFKTGSKSFVGIVSVSTVNRSFVSSVGWWATVPTISPVPKSTFSAYTKHRVLMVPLIYQLRLKERSVFSGYK